MDTTFSNNLSYISYDRCIRTGRAIMRKCDLKLLAYITGIYLLITTLGILGEAVITSFAIAVLLVTSGLALYCRNKTCKFY